jgi:DNA-binding response OmpR family regulator
MNQSVLCSPTSDPPSPSSGAFRAIKPRVMVIDDDGGAARQIAIALELEGVEAHTASDGDEALATFTEDIDLVLIELMLPRRSGLELARELKSRFPKLRIVLTGAYHLSERQLALWGNSVGCSAIAFVPKPCEPGVVAAFVKQKVTRVE